MTRRANLYLYPIEHNNDFIARCKSVYDQLGFSVRPFKQLFRWPSLRERQHNTVVLNWYEDQPYRQGLTGVKRALFVCGFLLSILSMRLFSRNIVWLRHNYKPHNVSHKPLLFRLTTTLLQWVSHQVVSLEPTGEFSSQVVKHPLYLADEALLDRHPALAHGPRDTDFLYFGAIKPYKRLDKMLRVWPPSVPLRILGKCSDTAHTALLEKIIDGRQLKVTWQNAFIEQDDLEQAVSRSRYVLIPHEDGAMVSSGSFYMALSFGANVVCFESAFGRAKAAEFASVQVVAAEQLASRLPRLSYTSPGLVLEQALVHNGEQAVRQAWQAVLGSPGRSS